MSIKILQTFVEDMNALNANQKIAVIEELIEMLVMAGDEIPCIKYCKILLDLQPRNICALRSLVAITGNEGEKIKLIAIFQSIVDENESKTTVESDGRLMAEIFVEYGTLLYASKKYEQAKHMLNEAINNDNKNCAAFYMLGFIILQTDGENGKSQALEYFLNAVKISPLNIYARVNLAQFYFKENNFDLALENLQPMYERMTAGTCNLILIPIYIKVLASKAIENAVRRLKSKVENTSSTELNCNNSQLEELDIDLEMLACAFKLCREAMDMYPGHVSLLMARSKLNKIREQFYEQMAGEEFELDDDKNHLHDGGKRDLLPNSAYGMVGVSIVKASNLKGTSATKE